MIYTIDVEVLEYLEFTQLSNRNRRTDAKYSVLEYLEFTQLSNPSKSWESMSLF